MQKLLYSLSIITIGLVIGYIIQRLTLSNIIKADKSLKKPRKALQSIAILILFPISTIGALWDFSFSDMSLFLLPIIGMIAILLGGFSAHFAGKLLKYEPKQAGALFSCGGMSNIGSIGALIVFVFLGEKAFALVPIYKLFEQIIYYAVWFPIAKSFSTSKKGEKDQNKFLKIVKDPYILVATLSIVVGIILNLTKIERPAFYSNLNAVIIPVGSLFLLSSIGMAMKFSKVKDYIKPALVLSFIKYLFVPFVATLIAYLIGYGQIDNAMPLKVVLILSSVPVGFIALVPPSIYDLDLDLANAGWLVSTIFLIIVIPLQMLAISFF
ncbi:MAG: hypothetical protein PQJ45_03840 [Sphaerochaetaceae bacterium]|nr:hypothetical protein [Sphaerochaetaceae bacterium]